MRKFFLALILVLPLAGFGQKASFLTDISGLIDRNVDQITSLAEAMPEDKLNWSPADGVRSAKSALKHVSMVNYMLGMNLGIAPPADVDPMTLEKMEMDKATAIKRLKASFDYAKKAISQLKKKDLKTMVELPFGKFSKRQLILIIYEHSGEHKGQLIAYARANGITPPWSEGN